MYPFLFPALIILISITGLFAESGRVHRKNAVHKGNLVKTVFGNWGVVGQPSDKGPRGAWIHENNGYVGDVSPFVGAQITTLDTSGTEKTFHTVVVSPVNRPTLGGHEISPTGKQWGSSFLTNSSCIISIDFISLKKHRVGGDVAT